MRYFILLISLLLTSIFPLNAQKWEIATEKKGIKVYTRLAKDSDFKEFKAEVIIDAPINQLSETILKIEDYPTWCYKTQTTKLLEKKDNAVYFYFISDGPPMIKKREAYYLYQRRIDEKSKVVTISMTTFETKNPVPSNLIRVPVSNGTWTLTPITASKTKVIFEMQAEPGGSIPSWLANLVVVESPLVTLNGLRQVVTKK